MKENNAMRLLLTSARRWHGGLAIILVFPVVLMALTAILIAHGKSLNTRNIYLNPNWLPGYQRNIAGNQQDIRGLIAKQNGWWLLTRAGLFDIAGNTATLVPALADKDIRAIVATPQGVLALSDSGLWREQQGRWTQIVQGNVMQASGNADTIVIIVRGKGPLQSHDGGTTWTSLKPVVNAALAQNPALSQQADKISLAQMIRDIHRGVAFAGDKTQWIWVDTIALLLIFMSGSGMMMWWYKQKNQMRLRSAIVER
jgi:hypothetical protein